MLPKMHNVDWIVGLNLSYFFNYNLSSSIWLVVLTSRARIRTNITVNSKTCMNSISDTRIFTFDLFADHKLASYCVNKLMPNNAEPISYQNTFSFVLRTNLNVAFLTLQNFIQKRNSWSSVFAQFYSKFNQDYTYLVWLDLELILKPLRIFNSS